jgi:Acetate kinase
MEEFLPAAPVHNRIYLDAIRAFRESLPGIPLVAAFETEFHRTMPEAARRYGVPRAWREAGVEKYGFHGASHEYVSGRAPEIAGFAPSPLRLVSCHLGGSSSICAIRDGRSVDVTMGFSPQSGLENATRHGDLDVFAVLWMMERHGWSPVAVRAQLAQESGLAGLAGVPGGDVRDIEAAVAAGSEEAALALDVFVLQVKKTIGAYAAAMGGVDLVAFTGGIGENSPGLRTRCLEGLDFLGLRLAPERNSSGAPDRLISPDGSSARVVTLATNEELIVARRTWRMLLNGAQ